MSTPAGWYPDTQATGGERWWDGGAWTDQRRPAGQEKAGPGWYSDPTMVDTRRYWDGEAWTEHRQAGGATAAAVEGNAGLTKVATRLLWVVLALVVLWLAVGPGWQVVTGSGTKIDVSDLETSIQGGLAERGVSVPDLACDDPGDVKQGDITYCRGTSGSTPVSIKVTFGRDGRFSYESQ